MPDRVIDCCSLINLYTGWQGLEELRGLAGTWYVCDAVIGEAERTREFDASGEMVWLTLDLQPFTRSGLLVQAHPQTEQEIADYVEFAGEVDDGEAQALAIAKNRGFAILTDDHKAALLARYAEVPVITTPILLRQWADRDPAKAARLKDIVRRISTLARFNPRADSPDRNWWLSLLED